MVDAPVKIWTGHLPNIHTGQKCYSFLSTTSFCTNLISNQRATQTSHLTTAGDNFVLQWAPDRPTERLPAGSHYWSMTVTKQETRSCISFPFSSAEGRPALYPSAWRQQRRYQYFSHADFRTSKLNYSTSIGPNNFYVLGFCWFWSQLGVLHTKEFCLLQKSKFRRRVYVTPNPKTVNGNTLSK
jgi:hypothetical protein